LKSNTRADILPPGPVTEIRGHSKLMVSQKVPKALLSSFRRTPESSILKQLQNLWAPEPAPDPDPGFTGVTAFYEIINFRA
jgi:hypothetical protein